MRQQARRWALTHLLLLPIVPAGFELLPALPGPRWTGELILGLWVIGLCFTLVMTRQSLAEDARLSDETRRRWGRRLLWLGPIGVLWFVLFEFRETGRQGREGHPSPSRIDPAEIRIVGDEPA